MDDIRAVCEGCGERFVKTKGLVRFCSVSCQLKHTVPVKTLTCIDCGMQFTFTGRTTKKRCDDCRKKFKSQVVMKSRKRKDPSVQLGIGSGGNQSPVIDNTTKHEEQLQRRREKYRMHREELKQASISKHKLRPLAEKAGKCEICGYLNVEALHVHHGDMNRKNNVPSNLHVLCANCHLIIHKRIRAALKAHNLVSPLDELIKWQAEVKSRNEAGTPDRATRTEGCE